MKEETILNIWPNRLTLIIVEFIEYWLQSILSHTVGIASGVKAEDDTSMRKSPLILVATHGEGKSKTVGFKAVTRSCRKKSNKMTYSEGSQLIKDLRDHEIKCLTLIIYSALYCFRWIYWHWVLNIYKRNISGIAHLFSIAT